MRKIYHFYFSLKYNSLFFKRHIILRLFNHKAFKKIIDAS